MKKYWVQTLAGISMCALLAGGCTNKGVKKEDALASGVTSESSDAEIARAAKAKADAEARLREEAEAKKRAAAEAKPVEIVPATDVTDSRREALNSAIAPVTIGNLFETVYFDYDKSELRQDSRDVLAKNAEKILKSYADAKIIVEGHCDERGSAEYNLALGERRAKAAQKYLTTLNVKAANLSIVSYGKEKPAVSGNDEAAWAKNRRAELAVIK